MNVSDDNPGIGTISPVQVDLADSDSQNQRQTSSKVNSESSTIADSTVKNKRQYPPVKIRKKPGRKPNPASPALRKAQNRAAQRAFRERKERHMRELETDVRAIREQRDELLLQNEKLSNDNEILKAENWYLKGIVLSLQLVCLQHNLSIPQHYPHVNDQTLAVLAQSIPKSIASYMSLKEKNKLKLPDKVKQKHSQSNSMPDVQGSQPKVTHGQVTVTQNGYQNNTAAHKFKTSIDNGLQVDSKHTNNSSIRKSCAQPSNPYLQDMPSLTPVRDTDIEEFAASKPPEDSESMENILSTLQSTIVNEPVSSNLAALQILRMRLRLQNAQVPVSIRPTLLQLTVPHDPRIDLLPTPYMRDRMILFKDQFDLDDCFRILLSGSVFHGGDPAVAENWQVPAEFFDKYWFLTINYDIRRCTNAWRKKQGSQEIEMNVSPFIGTSPSLTQTQTASPPICDPTVEANQYFSQFPQQPQQPQSSGSQFGSTAEHPINSQPNHTFSIPVHHPLYVQPSVPSNNNMLAAAKVTNKLGDMNLAPNSNPHALAFPQPPSQMQMRGQLQPSLYPASQPIQSYNPIQLQNNWDGWMLNSQGNVSNLQQNFSL